DHFAITKPPPRVDVSDRQYQFNRIPAAGHSFSPMQACPPSAVPDALALQYSKHKAEQDRQFARAQSVWSRNKPASETILGLEEAKLVADWSRRRAKGEKVASRPPTLASPTAIASAKPAAPAAEPAPVAVAATPAPESVPTSAYTSAEPQVATA